MRVYIAHSSKDRWIANQIARSLQARGAEVAIDAGDTEREDSTDSSAVHLLGTSDEMLLLISPSSLKSTWLFVQIGAAAAFGKKIVSILVQVSMTDLPAPLSAYPAFDLNEIEKYYRRLGADPATPREQNRRESEKVFISYSHVDKKWIDRIRIHLRVLQHEGLTVDIWDDTRIKPGTKWKPEIEKVLETATIAILIVSTDFLASDFVVNDELPSLLRAAEDHGLKVLPLIVRPCRFTKHAALSQFQAVNDPSRPLATLGDSEQEELFVKLTDVVEGYLSGTSK